MSKLRKPIILTFVTALVSTALAGCGGGQAAGTGGKNADPSASPTSTKPKDPVTIRMYNHFNNISDDRIQQFLIQPLSKKLPYVTLEVVKHGKGTTIDELVAAQNFTDFYYGSNPGFPSYLNLNLQFDMNDLIKKHKFDLNRFQKNFVDAIRNFGPNGEMYGVPFSANLPVLVYNKDIFDKFGVPYPKDGMTWDEAIELGKKLTRKDGNTQYIGFDPGIPSNTAAGLALSYVDKSNKVLLDTEPWKKILTMYKSAYDVQGYVQNGKFDYGFSAFSKDKNLAMLPVWVLQLVNAKTELAQMNWDMVSLPNFQGDVGRGREVDIHMLAISNVSKNRDDMMEVLKVITSDEVQKMMSESGTPSVLNNEEIKKVYGNNLPEFKGKNAQALFKTTPNVPHPITKFDPTVRGLVDGARKDITEGKDLNSIIRSLQETATKKVEEMK